MEEKLEAPSLSQETAALQILPVLWSDLVSLHQESGRKLDSHCLLFDTSRPTESPLMGSHASVRKHVSCSLVTPSFCNRIYFIFHRQTSSHISCVSRLGDFLGFALRSARHHYVVHKNEHLDKQIQ